MTFRLDFSDDPAEFLAGAADHLAARPVLNTVVASVAARGVAERGGGVRVRAEDWYVTVRDDTAAVVGVGMRTAPFPPHPLYLLPMPDPAAVDLARTLVGRGEVIGAVNGALAPATAYAEEVAQLIGGAVEVSLHSRLFELITLIDPRPVDGRLRSARPDEIDLVMAWRTAFHADADEQAGRVAGSTEGEWKPPDAVLRGIETGRVWLWVDPDDRPVHLTGCNHASFGAQRIGPVYTPPEQRGRGYASAAVAEVSRRILADGARPCLFTDQANPTSNKVYQAIGYVPVVDTVSLQVR